MQNLEDLQKEELTLKEIAELFDVKKPTVRYWVKSGKLKATKKQGDFGKTYYIKKEELQSLQKDRNIELKNEIAVEELQDLIKQEIDTPISRLNYDLSKKIAEQSNNKEIIQLLKDIKEQNNRTHNLIKQLNKQLEQIQQQNDKQQILDAIDNRNKAIERLANRLHEKSQEEKGIFAFLKRLFSSK